jgi:hypothetical protein
MGALGRSSTLQSGGRWGGEGGRSWGSKKGQTAPEYTNQWYPLMLAPNLRLATDNQPIYEKKKKTMPILFFSVPRSSSFHWSPLGTYRKSPSWFPIPPHPQSESPLFLTGVFCSPPLFLPVHGTGDTPCLWLKGPNPLLCYHKSSMLTILSLRRLILPTLSIKGPNSSCSEFPISVSLGGLTCLFLQINRIMYSTHVNPL